MKAENILIEIAQENGFDTWEQYFECFRTTDAGRRVINKGISYQRCYKKKDYFVYIAFGIEIQGKKTNFYFQTNKSNNTFQIDNNIENYTDAINGKLKPLESVFSEA